MLVEIYIEALLVDQEAADEIWEAWDSGESSDFWAAVAWWSLVMVAARERPDLAGHYISFFAANKFLHKFPTFTPGISRASTASWPNAHPLIHRSPAN